jgi:hypothetical protein
MDARAFDLSAIAWCGRVVDGHREVAVRSRSKLSQDHHDQGQGQRAGSSAHARQAIIEPIPVTQDACGGEPCRGTTTANRQHHPRHDDRQSKARTRMQVLRHRSNNGCHRTDQRDLRSFGSFAIFIRLIQPRPLIKL